MKKQLLLSGFAVLFGTIIISSCGYAGEKEVKLQMPAPSANTKNKEIKMKATDTKAKTIEDLQAAFKGESTASAKYAAYSKKAEKEGLHNIALLFKAASMAENVHANNHKSVLEEYGVKTPLITPEFTVKSTKENLEDAIKGETYESTTMYPGFLKDANTSGSQLALISFNYANEVEKKHKVMYEKALAALNNKTEKTLASVYYVCPTCGNTYDTVPPKRCGISMTGSEKFVKISSL